MSEQPKVPFTDRLALEQNLFDQPIFTRISQLGNEFGSRPYIYTATYITSGAFIGRMSGHVKPENINPHPLLQDEDGFRETLYRLVRTRENNLPIKKKLIGLP